MDNMKQASCAERIDANLQDRMEDIEAARVESAMAKDGKTDELRENVLDIEVRKSIKILLSTGGPADWFELFYDTLNHLRRAEYVFQDWGDVAHKDLTDEQAASVEALYLHGEPSSYLDA